MNHYIRSKLHAEALLRAATGDPDGPEIVVLRPRGIIGAGDTGLVPRLLRVHERVGVPLLRGGRGLVDLTAVENVAHAVRLAAEVPGAAGLAFNITNGDPRPFVELLDQLLTDSGSGRGTCTCRPGRCPRWPPCSRPCARCCPGSPSRPSPGTR